ncbi:MAG: hypothetical protein R3F05_05370 [Planctomycetota bacterium]
MRVARQARRPDDVLELAASSAGGAGPPQRDHRLVDAAWLTRPTRWDFHHRAVEHASAALDLASQTA